MRNLAAPPKQSPPKQSQPKAGIAEDRLTKAIDAIKAGSYTQAQLLENFSLTKEQIESVNQELKAT